MGLFEDHAISEFSSIEINTFNSFILLEQILIVSGCNNLTVHSALIQCDGAAGKKFAQIQERPLVKFTIFLNFGNVRSDNTVVDNIFSAVI